MSTNEIIGCKELFDISSQQEKSEAAKNLELLLGLAEIFVGVDSIVVPKKANFLTAIYVIESSKGILNNYNAILSFNNLDVELYGKIGCNDQLTQFIQNKKLSEEYNFLPEPLPLNKLLLNHISFHIRNYDYIFLDDYDGQTAKQIPNGYMGSSQINYQNINIITMFDYSEYSEKLSSDYLWHKEYIVAKLHLSRRDSSEKI